MKIVESPNAEEHAMELKAIMSGEQLEVTPADAELPPSNEVKRVVSSMSSSSSAQRQKQQQQQPPESAPPKTKPVAEITVTDQDNRTKKMAAIAAPAATAVTTPTPIEAREAMETIDQGRIESQPPAVHNIAEEKKVEPEEESLGLELEQEQVEEVVRGLAFAALADVSTEATGDDVPGESVVSPTKNPKSPWMAQNLEYVVGSTTNEDNGPKTLREVLSTSFEMNLDTHFHMSNSDIFGPTVGIQGFIGHSHDTIALSYEMMSSVFEWLEEDQTSTSEWDINKERDPSFWGFLVEMLCSGSEYKPTVHSEFYSNFMATLPLIQQHIIPLLAPNQPPRTLYVSGHSLGGSVATLAWCYFLLNFEWSKIPHRLILVASGSPRSVCVSMKAYVDDRLRAYGSDSVRLYRVVNEEDAMAGVPPNLYGFEHVAPAIQIKQGVPTQNPAVPIGHDTDTTMERVQELSSSKVLLNQEGGNMEELLAKAPLEMRIHLLASYIKPFLAIKGVTYATEEVTEEEEETVMETTDEDQSVMTEMLPASPIKKVPSKSVWNLGLSFSMSMRNKKRGKSSDSSSTSLRKTPSAPTASSKKVPDPKKLSKLAAGKRNTPKKTGTTKKASSVWDMPPPKWAAESQSKNKKAATTKKAQKRPSWSSVSKAQLATAKVES